MYSIYILYVWCTYPYTQRLRGSVAVAVTIGIVCPGQTSSPHPSPKSESKPESESAHPVLFLYFSTLYFLFFCYLIMDLWSLSSLHSLHLQHFLTSFWVSSMKLWGYEAIRPCSHRYNYTSESVSSPLDLSCTTVRLWLYWYTIVYDVGCTIISLSPGGRL